MVYCVTWSPCRLFSEFFLDHIILSTDEGANPKEVARTIGWLARTLTLWLGTELALRVVSSSKHKKSATASFYRGLVSLVLVAEYVSTWRRVMGDLNEGQHMTWLHS